MEKLKSTIASEVTIPKHVKRYGVLYYTRDTAWKFHNNYQTSGMFTTPESALEEFLRFARGLKQGDYDFPEFYKIVEFELEIPIIIDNER